MAAREGGDVEQLPGLLDRLVDAGKSVLVAARSALTGVHLASYVGADRPGGAR